MAYSETSGKVARKGQAVRRPANSVSGEPLSPYPRPAALEASPKELLKRPANRVKDYPGAQRSFEFSETKPTTE